MQLLLDEIWVTTVDLATCGVSMSTVYNGIMDKSSYWQTINNPSNKAEKLIRYSSLKPKYQELLKTKLWGGFEPREWLELGAKTEGNFWEYEETLLERIEAVVAKGYERYMAMYWAQKRSAEQVRVLARAAAVIEEIGNWYVEKGIDWRNSKLIGEVAQWLKENEKRYFYLKYLPTHPVRLKEKVLERWVEGAALHEVITVPREGNQNSEKFCSDKELISACYQLRSMGYNMTDAAIRRKIQLLCQTTGKEVPSDSWFGRFFAQTEVKRLTAAGRYGAKDYRRAGFYKGYVPGASSGALFAGDCWEMDGTRVNMLAHRGADGKDRPLYVVAVRDVMSGDVLGYSFGYAEDRWMVTAALRMAVECTGYLPYELRHDRFPGWETDEWKELSSKLERHGTKLTVAYSPRAKQGIERWFGTLQSVFMAETKYYYGEGIRSTRTYNHRSAETLLRISKELVRDGWNLTAAWQATERCIEAYRSTQLCYYSRKHATLDKSPLELHEESEKPHVKVLERQEIVELFWLTKTLGIRNDMVRMTVAKQEYIYPIFERSILLHHRELMVRYNEYDPSEVWVFDQKDGLFLGVLHEQEKVMLYGPNAEHDKLGKLKASLKAIEEADAADLEGYIAAGAPADEAVMLMPTGRDKGEVESAQSQYLNETMAWREELMTRPQRERAGKKGGSLPHPKSLSKVERDLRSGSNMQRDFDGRSNEELEYDARLAVLRQL